MFLDEARIASRVAHPNVCQVLDFGVERSMPYLIMEYLHGETLSTLMKRCAPGPCPLWLATRVIADAARGLHAAHDAVGPDGAPLAVVHRDVSPSNIMVLYDGITKVLDFGVAWTRNRLARSTTSHGLRGKLAYMAPEQLAGGEIDRRADVWALGVTLWETTVGEPLFGGTDPVAIFREVQSAPIRAPSELVPDYPPALEQAVLAALARDPAERVPTAAALADMLESYLYSLGEPKGHAQIAAWMREHLPERAHPSEAPAAVEDTDVDRALRPRTEVTRPRPRRPRRLAAWIVVAGAVVLAAALGWVIPSSTSPVRRASHARAERSAQMPRPPRAAPGRVAPEEPLERSRPTPTSERRGARPAGRLDLLVIPSARVFWRRRLLGETPLIGVSLPAGSHTLELRSGDGHTSRVTVSIRPGQRTRRTIRLAPSR